MHSLRTNVQIGMATLLEQCAQRRMQIAASFPHDPSFSSRSLQAEAAGRYLMTTLVQDTPTLHESASSSYRLLISYLSTLLAASTPDECVVPSITARLYTVELADTAALLLRDTLLLILLAALDDEASEIDVCLKRGDDGALLTVESDRPFAIKPHTALYQAQASVLAAGGGWEIVPQPHGGSWRIALTLPSHTNRTEVPYVS